jgi:hypothetical protein
MAMLAVIREKSPNAYNRLMADLYHCTLYVLVSLQLSNSSPFTFSFSSIATHLATTTTSNDDMALLNMVDMDV